MLEMFIFNAVLPLYVAYMAFKLNNLNIERRFDDLERKLNYIVELVKNLPTESDESESDCDSENNKGESLFDLLDGVGGEDNEDEEEYQDEDDEEENDQPNNDSTPKAPSPSPAIQAEKNSVDPPEEMLQSVVHEQKN